MQPFLWAVAMIRIKERLWHGCGSLQGRSTTGLQGHTCSMVLDTAKHLFRKIRRVDDSVDGRILGLAFMLGAVYFSEDVGPLPGRTKPRSIALCLQSDQWSNHVCSPTQILREYIGTMT